MTQWSYYNENDPQKAAWLRELIRENVIAPGVVDERSIADIKPDELRRFRQCHFFAGIGVWSYALRLAGWPDDRPVWTGSCPCPSFSAAGKGKGFNDPRHLWPHWASLIRECRPATVFGEQVASAIGHGWLDLVYVDLEAAAYSVGAAVLGACSVGAPHIRQRLYFCAHAASSRRQDAGEHGSGQPLLSARSEQCGGTGNDSNFDRPRCGTGRPVEAGNGGAARIEPSGLCAAGDGGESNSDRCDQGREGIAEAGLHGIVGTSGLGDASGARLSACEPADLLGTRRRNKGRAVTEPGPTSGFWSDCDWWYGRDGKYRPIEPGIQPLAHGATNRVLKLRGYGDAICSETAKAFIESVMWGGVTDEGKEA